jgi:predicted O-linked N-acetylglucosamine transferase (SPINDLY family)
MNISTTEDIMYDQAARIHGEGKLAEAEALYRQILARRTNHPHALFGLGTIAHQCGRNPQAIEILTIAAKLIQTSSLYNNLGEAYRALGRVFEAEKAFRRAMEIRPEDPMPYNNLGIVLCVQGRLREAEECWRHAIGVFPKYTDAINNLGNAMLEQGFPEESLKLHKQVIELQPTFARAHSNLLRDLNHIEPFNPETLRKEHARWWTMQAAGIKPRTSWNVSRDPERPLRIGLSSPDFREHSVAYFLEPWLAGRDRSKTSVICYGELTAPDDITRRLYSLVEGNHLVTGMPDDKFAELVVNDKIDILIDLAGHTSGNRLSVFAHRPAPVQASFLGYPFTSGSPTIDWKITDANADPPGMTEIAYTERLWRLPKTAWCYRPFPNAPEVSPPPAKKNGYITFGSFNALAKVTPRVFATWAEVLKRVPNSKFYIKSNALGDEGVRNRELERFAALGIGADRLILAGRMRETKAHIAAYANVDIALDTFPYNGTTTTCEALWMGVPVVGVAGTMHVERVGVSLLSTIGLQELVAPNVDEYVNTAAKLAADLPRLTELRATMRQRMLNSPLTDEKGYSRDFDEALRGMWRQWCSR